MKVSAKWGSASWVQKQGRIREVVAENHASWPTYEGPMVQPLFGRRSWDAAHRAGRFFVLEAPPSPVVRFPSSGGLLFFRIHTRLDDLWDPAATRPLLASCLDSGPLTCYMLYISILIKPHDARDCRPHMMQIPYLPSPGSSYTEHNIKNKHRT